MDHVDCIEKRLSRILFKIRKRGILIMDIKTIICKKRERRELTEDEIKLFVGKYQKEEITRGTGR